MKARSALEFLLTKRDWLLGLQALTFDPAFSDGKKEDLNNSLLKTGDSTKQGDVPISGSGRNSFAEETTMKSKKRESSISLGIFTC